jgi:hypothetical protein
VNAPDDIEDAAREARIQKLGDAMVMATDLTERARLWREMRAEIEARSVEQVLRMEKARGLA